MTLLLNLKSVEGIKILLFFKLLSEMARITFEFGIPELFFLHNILYNFESSVENWYKAIKSIHVACNAAAVS